MAGIAWLAAGMAGIACLAAGMAGIVNTALRVICQK